MLVLVLNNCRFSLNRIFANSIVCLVVAFAFPVFCSGQDENADPFGEYSVLEVSDETNSAAANGVISLGDNPAQSNPAKSTFTSQPLPEAPVFPDEPVPPRSLVIPVSPDNATFTKPEISMNALRSETLTSGTNQGLDQDRSGAQGTFAANNPKMQSPAIVSSSSQFQQPGQFAPPKSFTPPGQTNPNKGFQPPAIGNFEGAGGVSQRLGGANPAAVGSSNDSVGVAGAIRRDSNGGSQPGSTGVSSRLSDNSGSLPRATPWQRETVPPPTQSDRGVTSRMASNSNSNFSNPAGQVSGQSFNASATSNYNRGLNPNIASGVPSIQNQGAQSRLSDSMGRGLQPQSSYNRDSSVQPSGFNQPVPPAAPRKVRTALAKNLIARYSTDGLNPAQIPGTPVRLVELLKQPIATNQRQPLVHQFWDTYFDWASLVNAQEYLRMIESLPASASQAEQAMLQTAKMVARNDVLASEIQLVKSQSKLNQFNPNRRPNDPLPIPKDLPLIGSYTTNYQWYQSNQIMPESLLGIDKMLPKTLELISLRADTVEMAQRANQQLNSGLRNRQVSLTDTLNAAKELRSAEQNLLVAVMDYNHAITDYFFTIAQSEGYLPPETIVFSLLGSRKPKTQNPNQTANRVVERFRTARGEARQPQGQGSVNFGQGPRGGGANVGSTLSPQAPSDQMGFAQKRFEQTNSSSAQSGKAMPLGEASAWSREPNALQSGGSRYAGGQGTINGGQANGGFKLGGAAGQFSPSAQPQRPQGPPVINGSVAPAAPVARSGPGQFTPGAAPPGVFQPQVGGR